MFSRFSLEERLWLKPDLCEVEIEWIKYQLARGYPEKKIYFTDEILLTGFLRPVLGETSDDILDRIINQKTIQVNSLRIGDLKSDFEFAFEFTNGLLVENCKYSMTVQRIYESLDDLCRLKKKNASIGVILGNYLLAIVEYYGLTPCPLIPDQNVSTMHKALKCLIGLVDKAFAGLVIRLMPALTGIYFKSIKVDLLLSLRILNCIRDLGHGNPIGEQVVRALEKRAIVDFVPVNGAIKSLKGFTIEDDHFELGNVAFPKILKHLCQSKSRDMNIPSKELELFDQYPFLYRPTQMTCSVDGQLLFMKDSMDQLFLIRTRDFNPKESFSKMDMAKKILLEKGVVCFCLCRWSDELVIVKNVGNRVIGQFLKIKAMMGEEEIEKASRREVFKCDEFPRGVEFLYRMGKEGDLDSILMIIYTDKVVFINQENQRYLYKFEDEEIINCWCLEENFNPSSFLWISTRSNKLYQIDIMTGLEASIRKIDSRPHLLTFFQNNLKVFSLGKRGLAEEDITSCVATYPTAMVMGTTHGKVYSVDSDGKRLVTRLDEPVLQIQWLWYPEGVLLVHGLSNLYVYK
jgi:hypothetical protein